MVRRAEEEGIRVRPAVEMSAIAGRGVTARVGDELVCVGSERLFRDLGAVDGRVHRLIEGLEAEGRTIVLVGTAPARAAEDGRLDRAWRGSSRPKSREPGCSPMPPARAAERDPFASRDAGRTRPEPERAIHAPPVLRGALAVADRIRPDAAMALRELRRVGIEQIVVLTGDNSRTARAVAGALARSGGRVDAVRAELLPENKLAAIRDLRHAGSKTLMVGDGVNDAPALAAADVGVAMGAAGSDVALETADIALMADDLSKLPVTIRYARKAAGIIRVNIAVALFTKGLFVVLAAAGLATLWMAVLADMGASLLVIGNGLRALRL